MRQAGRVRPRARRQRHRLVEELAGVGDHLVAAHLVVAAALLGAVGLGDHVGAVQRVVQRAPAGVGGVEREPRVEHRHHELRAGGRGDLGVDTRGGDGEVGGFGLQITDFGEELPGRPRGRCGSMTRWRCHLSIWACSSSRRASRSWFCGVRSVTTLSTPAQKLSGSMSVPGSASLVTKSCSTLATRRLPTVTRSVIVSSLDPGNGAIQLTQPVTRLPGSRRRPASSRSHRARSAARSGAARCSDAPAGNARTRRGPPAFSTAIGSNP